MKNLSYLFIAVLFSITTACAGKEKQSNTTDKTISKTIEEEVPKAVKKMNPVTEKDGMVTEVLEVKTVVDKKESLKRDKPEEKGTLNLDAKSAKPTQKAKSSSLKKEVVKADPKPINNNLPKVVETQTEIVSDEKDIDNSESTPESEPSPVEEPIEEEIVGTPSHDVFDQLLQKHVDSRGNVSYTGFKADQKKLQEYLDLLANNPIQSEWNRKEKMAYWINAYNAFTIKLILDNYPLNSITNLDNGKVWDRKWIKLGDKTYSLNQIENDILRPRYKDARIHFAVNCAAASCPPLLNKAWTAENLEVSFQKQATAFINNPKYNSISANEVKISKIFEWYSEDFGNIIDYLNKYSNTKINADANVSYMEYDWALNKK